MYTVYIHIIPVYMDTDVYTSVWTLMCIHIYTLYQCICIPVYMYTVYIHIIPVYMDTDVYTSVYVHSVYTHYTSVYGH